MRPRCRCGRFLRNAHAIPGTAGEGYSWRMFVADVRGDCSRCGSDVQAQRDSSWSWDAWKWPAELEGA